MMHVRVSEIAHYVGQEVIVKGWLYNKRSSGKILFPQIRDGSGIIQGVVLKANVPEQVWEALDHLPQESSLIVRGTVREEPRAPGGYEIEVHDAEIVSVAEPYPLGKKDHGIEFLLDHRHLWLRSRRPHAVLKIRHEVIRAIRDFFDSNGFVLCDAPIFTPAACEGTTTLFEVNYFEDQKAYLTQSGQLYMEAACMAFGKVYCFGPTFRAERSKTRRHLTEFWMVEPEVAYATLDDIMELAEHLVTFVLERVLARRRAELELLERDLSRLESVRPPFPRLSYDDAVRLLREGGFDFSWGDDFGSPHETYLSEHFDKPVIIHRYPAAVKAFYMEPDPERPELALCMDMLAPEGYGEIIGGGQRIASLELLRQRIREHHLPEEAFDWYLDLRRYGSVPHSGFGLGLERTVAWICGLEHVREAIPFPRMLYRLKP
jgi:asparaginyl-tRNA synthetase